MSTAFQPPPTWALPVLTDEKTGRSVFNPIWLKWFVDLTGIINASGGGGGTVTHNSLSGLQGGTTGQRYHLTAAEHTAVGAFTGGYTGTIITAKLTALGATGSMTFTNGVLTAQTPAT